MAWSKPPRALVELFTESLPDDPGVEPRKVFGLPSAFVNGAMFAGVFQDSVFARLPPDERAVLERDYGAKVLEPMPGRPMTAYVVLPDDVVADEGRLSAALQAAFAFTATLPPKVKKARTAKAKTSAKA